MQTPVEQIKEKIDIVELVGSYVKLQKAGANFKALCPFHSEKTPSFYVTPARQIWHCFGCNLGGDIFRFVMNIEGVEFPEALRILAEKAGVELKREDPKIRSERTRFLDLLDEAVKYYEKNLFERKDVGAYLKERGMAGETAKSFRLGYALNLWDGVINHLKQKGFKTEEIEKTGLAIKSEKETGYYDRFRARIMFPLFDSAGRIVGFSGRIFEKDSQEADIAKYINTPQTVIYDKSRLLYGFDRAKTEIRKKNEAIILEGQMDLIMSHQAGSNNAVAVSGTALTPSHLRNLKRLCDTLIMSFDTDAAGFAATTKSVDLALSAGFEIKIAGLSSAKDPADLIKESPDAWHKTLEASKPVVAFLLSTLGAKIADALTLKKEVRRLVLPYVTAMAGELDRAHWVGEIASFLKTPEEIIWNEVKKIKINKNYAAPGKSDQPDNLRKAKTRRSLLEERLIGLVCWKNKELLSAFAELETQWFSPERRHIFEAGLAGQEPDEHYAKKLSLEAEVVYAGHDDLASEIKELARELKKENLKERLEALSIEIKACEEAGHQEELQKKFEEFKTTSTALNTL